MEPPRRPEDAIGRDVPDLTLAASDGASFGLRSRVGRGPLILFFYIRNASPGWILELREFRAHHRAYVDHGLTVAGVTRESVESNRTWAARLKLPYLLLSDPEGHAGSAFGVTRRVGLGEWSIQFFRRSTFLIDLHGVVQAVWREVRIRGHALEVMETAKALGRSTPR